MEFNLFERRKPRVQIQMGFSFGKITIPPSNGKWTMKMVYLTSENRIIVPFKSHFGWKITLIPGTTSTKYLHEYRDLMTLLLLR